MSRPADSGGSALGRQGGLDGSAVNPPANGPTLSPQANLGVGARLIYLMGPSGSGKDTLLRLVRAGLGADEPVLVAHRYITRASGSDEACVQVSAAEFERRAALGCFALHWRSHGLRYGVGIELDQWLAAGAAVIVNGSRQHLPVALLRYPALTAVEVTVERAILAQRLASRGRETAAQIVERLAGASLQAATALPCATLFKLENNAAPELAAGRLLALIREKLAA